MQCLWPLSSLHLGRIADLHAGGLPLQLVEHALESFARTAGATLHVSGTGRNDHHLAEAAFKALGRALRVACEIDPRRDGVASTKGVLE